MARPAGLEPTTPGLGILCSIRLSYGRDQIFLASRSGFGQSSSDDGMGSQPLSGVFTALADRRRRQR